MQNDLTPVAFRQDKINTVKMKRVQPELNINLVYDVKLNNKITTISGHCFHIKSLTNEPNDLRKKKNP